MMSVDAFLARRHRGDEYNCLHFARDVWLEATGEDLGARMADLLTSSTGERRIGARHRRAFERLDRPADPCLVMMRRGRTEPHVGVYLRGRVLHLTERGAEFHEPAIASRGFQEVEFYR